MFDKDYGQKYGRANNRHVSGEPSEKELFNFKLMKSFQIKNTLIS